MATIKFWQEMQKATEILGADKMMIGKDATGEAQYTDFELANQFLNVQGIEMKPVPAGALPAGPADQVRTMEILEAGTWTFGGNSFVNPSGSIMKLWWDGTTWSLGSSVPLPTTPVADDVVEGGTEATSQDGVFQFVKPTTAKIDKVVKEDDSFEVLSYVNPDATAYGNSSTILIYKWGFPVKPLLVHGLEIKVNSVQASKPTVQRLIVRQNNKTGAILLDRNYNLQMSSASTQTLRFDFSDTPIDGTQYHNLYVQLITNQPVGIFRVMPPEIFIGTQGYPQVSYSSNSDTSVTDMNNEMGYADIFHNVLIAAKEVTDLSDWTKEKMEPVINTAPKYAWMVEPGTKVTNIVGSTGGIAYGNISNYRGWGFAGEALQRITQINIKIGVRVAVTKYRIIAYYNSLGGAIAYDSGIVNLDISVANTYLLQHKCSSIIQNAGLQKMYYTLYVDGAIYVYRTNPAVKFTGAAGYARMANPSNATDMGTTPVTITGASTWSDVDHSIDILEDVEGYQFTDEAIEEIASKLDITPVEVDEVPITNENERTSLGGSSVTAGGGYLQTGYVAEYITAKQSKYAKAILGKDFESAGTILENRKYFLGKAVKLTGVGKEIEFTVKGNEVSIIQAIERSNLNASEIEMYIDGELFDTFNNYNTAPIGATSKNFTGDGSTKLFDLGRAFTYSHVVKLDGVENIVVHNTLQGTGWTIPANADCGIIRRIGIDENGQVAVTHWLTFKVAPTSGASVSVDFQYGTNLVYEKTTIGEDTNGVTECPYGDGTVSFDPTNPAGISSGLDFRETDTRVVKTYRFLESKERKVKLKIKGNYGSATGTPYFIFNFATNRYFHFQNAGVGGWSLWNLDKTVSEDPLRGWQRIAQFAPDKLVLECTPNDDWLVMGYRVYTQNTWSYTDMRYAKNMPLRHIAYSSANNNYTMSRWKGIITAITEVSVTFSGTIDTPIVPGDYVMIGQYWANNKDYVERIVSSVSGNTIYFDKPIGQNEIIYNSLADFVGKEIEIRDLSLFKNKLQGLIDKIQSVVPDCDIHLLENPMPNVLSRDLWGYPLLMDKMSKDNRKVYSVDYTSLRRWQLSQPKAKVNLDVSTAVFSPYYGKRVLRFGAAKTNQLAVDIKLNGVSIYGNRAVLLNSWAYTVNQLVGEGAVLNKSATAAVSSGQVYDQVGPALVILDDTLTTGTVTVEYASALWSDDSCHMNSNGSKLYADFLKDI